MVKIYKNLVNVFFCLVAVMQLTAVPAYAAGTKVDIKECEVKITERYFYEEHRPQVTISNGEHDLEEGEDYMLALYSDPDSGAGKAYIKGINDYTGTIEKTFEVETLANVICDYASSDEFLGIPYVWGGTTKDGFDCSGFVQYVYNHFGISITRTTWTQCEEGTRVSMDELQPGDIVFFLDYGHEGLYLGDGKFVQSASDGVMISFFKNDPRDGDYWYNHYCGATRIL